jgi:Ca-activated chloride channel family protein
MNHRLGLFTPGSATNVKLKRLHIDASVHDLLCDVSVEQEYENVEAETIEVVYIFPLPPDKVLLDVQVQLGEKLLQSSVICKSDSAHPYETAIAAEDAAIRLERLQSGLCIMNIGNLQPFEKAVITVRYAEFLLWTGDAFSLRFSAALEPRDDLSRVAPYSVPEPGLSADCRFTWMVQVSGLLTSSAISCSTHFISTQYEKGLVRIALAMRATRMDRDLSLQFNPSHGACSSAVRVRHKNRHIVMLSRCPPPFLANIALRPARAVKIVIDCSSAMQGDAIAASRRALNVILEQFQPQDHFDILCFGATTRALFGELHRAVSWDLAHASRWAETIAADMGPSDTGLALQAAYEIKGAAPGIRPDIFLVTNGQTGNPISVIETARGSGHRIFTVGIGAGVAETFVRELATATGGTSELLAPEDEMWGRILGHFVGMNIPRVRDVHITWPGSLEHQIPSPPDIVYEAEMLHAFAWVSGPLSDSVSIGFTREDGRTVGEWIPLQPLPVTRDPSPAGHPIARVAASRWLAQSPQNAQAIALEYQLLTEHTEVLIARTRVGSEKTTGVSVLHAVAHVLAGLGHLAPPHIGFNLFGMTQSGSFTTVCPKPKPSPLQTAYPGLMPPVYIRAPYPKLSFDWKTVYHALERYMASDPTTGELVDCGFALLDRATVPYEYIYMLRHIASAGPDEASLTLAFLKALSDWEREPHFSASTKLMISKAQGAARKGSVVNDELADLFLRILNQQVFLRESFRWDTIIGKLDSLLRTHRAAGQSINFDYELLSRCGTGFPVHRVMYFIAFDKGTRIGQVVLALLVLLARKTTAPHFSPEVRQMIEEAAATQPIDPEIFIDIKHNIAIEPPVNLTHAANIR